MVSSLPRAILKPDPIRTILGEKVKGRLRLLTRDHTSRTSSHVDLLSRADLREAISFFSRMVDNLD
jgi:hypothetical protein